MLFVSSLFALLLAGVSHAIPAPSSPFAPAFSSSAVFINSTKISSSILPAQPTAGAKNGTASATFSASNFTDVAPIINPNATLNAITKPDGVKPDSIAIRRPITCETLIKSKAKQLGFGKPTSGFIFDSNWGTVHLDYRSAAIYCHDVRHGAHAVYGAIWRKWSAQNGHYGYPITDETGATDNAGTHIRYNVFSRTNAIYWTGQHGAFLIYGDIYRRWLSIGDVKSSVGYPITDETGSGNYGGRYNDFSNGMIYWHAGTSWVHVGGLPESITWKWDPIKLNEVTGSNIVTIYSNGNVNWVSHMHDHIALKYEWAIGWVLVDADGTAVSLTKSGTVGPNLSGIPIFGGPKHDNNIDTTVYNSVISDNWRAWVAWNHGSGKAHNSLRIVSLIKDIINDIQQVYPYVTTAIAILS